MGVATRIGVDVESLPVGVVRVDRQERIVAVNAAFTRWHGAQPTIGRPLSDVLDSVEDFLDEVGETSTMMVSPADPAKAALVTRAEDAEGAVLTVLDASDRYRAGRKLRDSQSMSDRTRARLELVIDSSIAFAGATTEEQLGEILAGTAASAYRAEQSAVFLTDGDGRMHLVAGSNPIEGFPQEAALTAAARTLRNVVTVSDAPGLPPLAGEAMRSAGIHAVLAAPIQFDSVLFGVMVCFFLHPRQFDEEAAPLAEALAGQAAQTLATMRLQARLAHAAMHDDTTGLPNRRYLDEHLEALEESDRVSVIFIDLDGFKDVNDRFGHQLGDDVLREVAARIQATTGEREIIARYGGDEFVVVCAASATGAAAVAERIRAALDDPIEFLPTSHIAGASIGVASAEPGGPPPSLDRLIRSADQAMYVAKNSGGNRVVTVSPPAIDPLDKT